MLPRVLGEPDTLHKSSMYFMLDAVNGRNRQGTQCPTPPIDGVRLAHPTAVQLPVIVTAVAAPDRAH